MWEEVAWPGVTQVGKLLANLVQGWLFGAWIPPLQTSLRTLEEGADAAPHTPNPSAVCPPPVSLKTVPYN